MGVSGTKWSTCSSLCTCRHMCVWVHIHMHVETRGKPPVRFLRSNPFCWGPLTGLKLPKVGKASWQGAPGITCLPLSSPELYTGITVPMFFPYGCQESNSSTKQKAAWWALSAGETKAEWSEEVSRAHGNGSHQIPKDPSCLGHWTRAPLNSTPPGVRAIRNK